MKSHRLAAVFAAAVSTLALASCATDSGPNQASDRSSPCLGVAPATGTSLVRKEDCGIRPQQATAAPAAQPASASARQ